MVQLVTLYTNPEYATMHSVTDGQTMLRLVLQYDLLKG